MSLRSRILPAFALFAALFCPRPASATIEYSVSVAHPEKHIVGVSMRVPAVTGALVLQMPAWSTLYQIRDFSSHVMQVSASDEANHALPIAKLDKQTWQVSGSGTVTISYSAYWDEPGPFASQLNPDHAFFNLGMILLYVPDRRSEETRLRLEGVPEGWRVAVELDATGISAGNRGGAYEAAGYDALIDAPVEIGAFEEIKIEAGGVPIRVVIHGDAGDRARLSDALKRIVNYQVALMRGAPFREYMFLFHVGANFGGGGMEHSNCTTIAADLPVQLASYAAHELFHAWNVKRIRPQSLEPPDYTREMWTRALWFAEGVTNTYGSYTLVRTGLWSAQQFYSNLASQISDLQSRPARRWQSAEQSSLDAWLEKYPLYLRPEESISYYNKGQILGVLLDIEIRDRTGNAASLDEVLRWLNDEFARRGKFYNDTEDIRRAAESVIRKAAPDADSNLGGFFTRYVSGTEEIPYDEILGHAGLDLHATGQPRVALGFAVNRDPGGAMTVAFLDPDSAAAHAGLRDGDILVSINGEPFPRSPDRWLRDYEPGERATVKARRGDEQRDFSFLLDHAGDSGYQISDHPGASERQRRIREGILHGSVAER